MSQTQATLLDDPETGTDATTAAGRDSQPVADDLTRNGRHWERWELGQLLTTAEDGGSLDEVATAQRRSLAGVQRMLARLLAGEVRCPSEYQPHLNAIKLARDTAAKAEARRPDSCCGRCAEQYRALMQATVRMIEVLTDIRAVAGASFAVGLADGSFPPAALSTHVTPRLGQHLVSWAADIRKAFTAAQQPTDSDIEADLKQESESMPAEFDTH